MAKRGSRNCAILEGCRSSSFRRLELLLPLTDRSRAALDEDDDDVGSVVGTALSPTSAAGG